MSTVITVYYIIKRVFWFTITSSDCLMTLMSHSRYSTTKCPDLRHNHCLDMDRFLKTYVFRFIKHNEKIVLEYSCNLIPPMSHESMNGSQMTYKQNHVNVLSFIIYSSLISDCSFRFLVDGDTYLYTWLQGYLDQNNKCTNTHTHTNTDTLSVTLVECNM